MKTLDEFKKLFDEKLAAITDEELEQYFPLSISHEKKLYKIIVKHMGPKDSHESIETYLIAKDDIQVYDHIDKTLCYGCWTDRDEESISNAIDSDDNDTGYYKDDDYEQPISFRQWVMLNKGNIGDDNESDYYYGITQYGWEEVEVINQEDLDVLVDLKIAEDITEL